MRNISGAQLLLLDYWGLEPLDNAGRHDLLGILEKQYGCKSTIVPNRVPVERWHEVICNPIYANAILHRLVHNAHWIELSGDSMRRTRLKPALRDWPTLLIKGSNEPNRSANRLRFREMISLQRHQAGDRPC